AVWAMAFLLAAGPLNHVIIVSLEMSAALVAGAPFGYGAAIGAAAWAALGNVVGGLGLVTVLRLVQLGRDIVEAERPSADANADTADT
ncbi:MAG: formate/nitrite transporter family protein, partial [Acidimicrobiales bacterium]